MADEEPKTAEESMEFESNPQEDTGVLNASSFNGIDETNEDVELAFEDSPPTKNKVMLSFSHFTFYMLGNFRTG